MDDHRVEVTFKGGRVGVLDCRPYFSVGYYKPLRDPELFKKAHVSLGHLAWPGDKSIGSTKEVFLGTFYFSKALLLTHDDKM